MENKESFFNRIENHLSPFDLNRVKGAYYLAKFGHRSQIRKEIDNKGNALRYFEHVRRVALILIDETKTFDADLICTALLHDTLEDTQDINAEIIEQFFGINVAKYVKILTKSNNDNYIDRLMYGPWQTALVKACDRLDNLRSLDGCTKEFQKKQLKETYNKYMLMFDYHNCKKIKKLKINSVILESMKKYGFEFGEINESFTLIK